MRRVTCLVLASLACASYGRRTHVSMEPRSRGQVRSEDSQNRFAALLLALDSTNAFRPSGHSLVMQPRARNIPAIAHRQTAVQLQDDEPDPTPIIEDAEEKFQKTVSVLDDNLASLRTGRATPALLDRIQVDYYGAMTPLNQIAGITAPTATQLQVDVYDMNAIGEVEKAIQMSDVGMTPLTDGKTIRLNVPPMSTEKRKEFAKKAKKIGEESKTGIRNVRKTALDKIKKMKKKLSEDAVKDAENSLQKVVKKYEEEVSKKVAAKEKDLSSI